MNVDEMHKWATAHLLRDVGRATLAIGGFAGDGKTLPGTAFLYNHLVEQGPEYDRVVTFLVTAGALARCDMAEIWLRDDCIAPPGPAADKLISTRFAEEWTLAGSGADEFAVTPFAHYEEHARSKGWSWDTQEITFGLCPKPDDWARFDRSWAYVVFHSEKDTFRPLTVTANGLQRDGDRWTLARELPRGTLGSPIFSLQLATRGDAVRLVIVGLVGDDRGPTPAVIPMSSVQALTAEIVDAADNQ